MDSDYVKVQASKTPATWIAEICTKQQNIPKYDIFDCKGELNSPIPKFKCILQVTYNGEALKAEAVENTIKAAKQSAAKKMLDSEMKLTPKCYFEINGGNKVGARTEGASTLLQAFQNASAQVVFIGPSHTIDAEMGANPIGELKDFCSVYNLGPPEYKDKGMEGLPHCPLFEIECFLCNQFKSEKGTTKKLAKKRVAHRWLFYLKSLTLQEIEDLGGDISGTNLRVPCPWSSEQCAKVISHKNHLFQTFCGELIDFLRSDEYNENQLELRGGPQIFLDLLGKECNFVAEYRVMEKGAVEEVEDSDEEIGVDSDEDSDESDENEEDFEYMSLVEENSEDGNGEQEEKEENGGKKETGIEVGNNENANVFVFLSIKVEPSKDTEAVFLSAGETEEAAKSYAALQAIEHIQDLSSCY